MQKTSQLSQQFEEAVETLTPEEATINLITQTGGRVLPKSGDPDIDAMVAYNQAKLADKSDEQASKKPSEQLKNRL